MAPPRESPSQSPLRHFYVRAAPDGGCWRCGGLPTDPIHLTPGDEDARDAAIVAAAPNARRVELGGRP